MIFPIKSKNMNPKVALLLKGCAFILCVLIGYISIFIISTNTKNYIDNEERIKQEKAELIIQKEKERDALILIEKQRKERKKLQAEFVIDKQQIQSKAEYLANSGDYLKAISSLKNYQGKFFRETSRLRTSLIDLYRQKHDTTIRAKRGKVLQDIVKLLLGKKYSAAKSKLMDYPPPVPKKLSVLINEIANLDKQIANTYLNDIGGIIAVKLQNRGMVTAKLVKVDGENLVIQLSGKKQVISVSNLVPMEKMKRVKFLSKAGKALYLGSSAWTTDSKSEALRYFSKLPKDNPLSAEIIVQTDPYKGRKAETDSRIALFRVLSVGALLEDDIDEDFITEQLGMKEANKIKDRQLKELLDVYCHKFKNTAFKKKYEKIICEIYDYLDDKVDFLRYSQSRIGTRKTISQRLHDQPPEAFWDVPPTNNRRYFAKVEVGKYNSINIVVDIRKNKPFGRFAVDDDLDFNDKPELILNKWQSVPLLCKYDKLRSQKFAIEFKFDPKRRKILYRVGCARTGLIRVGNNVLEFTITDKDAYGNYSRILKNTIAIRKPGKMRIIKMRSNFLFEVNGKSYNIVSIEKNGTHIEITESSKVN